MLLDPSPALAADGAPAAALVATLTDRFKAGEHAALADDLERLLARHPGWWGGWDLLCTVRLILGQDAEPALVQSINGVPEGAAPRTGRKVFCIGANKTGTTSIARVFRQLGLQVGNQAQAEMLVHDWARGDFRRLIHHCRYADAFQDLPFSLPGSFRALDAAYPGARFILTVRESPRAWFESLLGHHRRLAGHDRTPTAADLRQVGYRYPGFVLDVLRLSYGADEGQLYDRQRYCQHYREHNASVKAYFSERPQDLLVLDVGHPNAMRRLLTFLGVPYEGQRMPHLNRAAPG